MLQFFYFSVARQIRWPQFTIDNNHFSWEMVFVLHRVHTNTHMHTFTLVSFCRRWSNKFVCRLFLYFCILMQYFFSSCFSIRTKREKKRSGKRNELWLRKEWRKKCVKMVTTITRMAEYIEEREKIDSHGRHCQCCAQNKENIDEEWMCKASCKHDIASRIVL